MYMHYNIMTGGKKTVWMTRGGHSQMNKEIAVLDHMWSAYFIEVKYGIWLLWNKVSFKHHIVFILIRTDKINYKKVRTDVS
jgi:hypothetical protein